MSKHAQSAGELSRYFRISSRSHHGIVFMSELARHATSGKPVSIRTIAEKMHLSDGYLEELVGSLRDGSVVRGARGRNGGYVLARPAKQITVGEIMRILDGPVVLAACQDLLGFNKCPVAARCTGRRFFGRLKNVIDRELNSTTLADLV